MNKRDFLTGINHDRDMKAVHCHKTEGKVISYVYDAGHQWQEYPSGTRVPGSDKLMNYDLRCGDRKLLVLDNYGNDFVLDEIQKRLVPEVHGHGWLLAIDRESGEIFTLVFYSVKRKLIGVFAPVLPPYTDQAVKMRVPKKYLKHLDWLKGCKRPWYIASQHQDWLALWQREMNWSDFAASVVVNLSIFPRKASRRDRTMDKYLEVWGDTHRIVSGWA